MRGVALLSCLALTASAATIKHKRSVCDELPWLANTDPNADINIPGLVVHGKPVDGSDCHGGAAAAPPAPPAPPAISAPPAPPATSAPPAPPATSAPPADVPPPAVQKNYVAVPQSTPDTVPATTSQAATPASTPNNVVAGPGGCKPGLKNIVFNGGMTTAEFDLIGAAENWITFQLDIPGNPSPHAAAAHIPMMPFASDVPKAVELVTGPNPPAWMLTFNEPDFSYMGLTPTMSPQEAAAAIQPLLQAAPKHTKFVAPVSADPNSNWLPDFYAACNCKDFFSAYNIHVYTPSYQAAFDSISNFHTKFSDKPIWITEIAPGMANPPCSVGQAGVTTFMQQIFHWSAQTGYVDKVFWNSGNQIQGGDINVCESYLTNFDGSASPLLPAYQALTC